MLVKPRRSANSTTAWVRTSAVDEQAVAQLRVLEDLVREPRRDVAAEGLPQHLFAAFDFSLELSRGDLSPHRSRSHEASICDSQRLISRHSVPKEIILLRRETTTRHLKCPHLAPDGDGIRAGACPG